MMKNDHECLPVSKKAFFVAALCFCIGICSFGCDSGQTIQVTVQVEGAGVIRDITTGWDGDNGSSSITTDTETNHIFIASFSPTNDLEGWYYNAELLSSEDTVEVTFKEDGDTLVARFTERPQDNAITAEECRDACNSATQSCLEKCLELYDIQEDMSNIDKLMECSTNCENISQECLAACDELE